MSRYQRIIPTYERVRELFDYDPNTGIMIRRCTVGVNHTALEGGVVGHKDTKGYLNVRVDNYSFKLHRIIWLWWHGYWTENQLDHINRVKDDNRIANLREVSQICNSRNVGCRKDSSSGINGVQKRTNRRGGFQYTSTIGINYKANYLITTSCLIEACAYRLAAEQCAGWTIDESGAETVIKEYVCQRKV